MYVLNRFYVLSMLCCQQLICFEYSKVLLWEIVVTLRNTNSLKKVLDDFVLEPVGALFL